MTAPTTLPPNADTGADERTPSPAPGPHTQHMRRLIAVFAAIATIVMSGFTTASVRVMAQVSGRWAFWLLLPTLVLPSVIAGGAAAIGLLRFIRRAGADDSPGLAFGAF